MTSHDVVIFCWGAAAGILGSAACVFAWKQLFKGFEG